MTRVVMLAIILVGTGVAAGFAIGYPLRGLEIGADNAVVLDQSALTGIDLSDALVQQSDLESSFSESPDLVALIDLVGAEFCGGSVTLDSDPGARAARAFVDQTNNAMVLSEAVRAKDTTTAGRFVSQMTSLLDDCEGGRYFKVENGERTEVEISNTRRDVPLRLDYVTRTITPVRGGMSQVVTFFQVGNVVVALQYAGPEKAYSSLMDNVERKILTRLAPDQFSETVAIDGEQPMPTDVTTTTRVNIAEPSPTSSVDQTLESLPPATFEPPTTTSAPRGRSGSAPDSSPDDSSSDGG